MTSRFGVCSSGLVLPLLLCSKTGKTRGEENFGEDGIELWLSEIRSAYSTSNSTCNVYEQV